MKVTVYNGYKWTWKGVFKSTYYTSWLYTRSGVEIKIPTYRFVTSNYCTCKVDFICWDHLSRIDIVVLIVQWYYWGDQNTATNTVKPALNATCLEAPATIKCHLSKVPMQVPFKLTCLELPPARRSQTP